MRDGVNDACECRMKTIGRLPEMRTPSITIDQPCSIMSNEIQNTKV